MSLLSNEVEVLRRSPLFQGIEPARLKLIAFTSETALFAPGDVLFRQGEMGDSAYVILSGEVAVLAQSPVGEIELARLGEQEIVGEIGILCDVPRTATVRACGEVKTLRIGKECLSEMLDAFPTMAQAMLRELAFRLSHTSSELVQLRTEAAGEKH
ncbi:cyclic nucleotide-binding domain-containing protein [Aureimonas fodinaquatilis]|uniref:Cyclic nucleotide-binding domain-containing protein n=1 Tax=Aureimonas fodinaquatilis TaxID=2565783 RepID=A0A5B0DUX3_9HYPH|nr:cyclic nucleotide-binding domain-containing protein [Aureimonas fodinaquatilis]KAA0968999.1 cyclic nucleotide-binding domain-containing protein [Aureimonas fodinaquatilis]